MPDSCVQVVADSAHASLPQAVSQPPTSSSLAQVEPFNSQTRQAFQLMLESRKNQARERITAFEKQKYIKWLTDIVPDRLGVAESKERAWVKNGFSHEQGKLWKSPGRASGAYKQRREVISEDIICDTIISVHSDSNHAGQRATGAKVKNEYYGVADSEVTFLGKICGVVSGGKTLFLAKVTMCMRPYKDRIESEARINSQKHSTQALNRQSTRTNQEIQASW